MRNSKLAPWFAAPCLAGAGFCWGCSVEGEGTQAGVETGGTSTGDGGSFSGSGGVVGSGGSLGSGGGSGGAVSAGGSGSGGGGTLTGGASGSGGETSGTGGDSSGSGGEGGNDVSKSAGCGSPGALQDGDNSVQSGGTNRNYKLRVPVEYDPDHAYRLILGFHGATGQSADIAPSYFGLWELSEGSTIFVAPDAVGGIWDSETDIVFVDDILGQVTSELCIDTSRIELEGFSQGGAMAWTLACARPGVFRAAVVHSGGGLARPETCEPVAFMSSLGQSESSGAGQTSNSDFFAGQNGCTVEPLAQAPGGGHACSDYQGCSEGHPTRWCDYDGGHTPAPNDQGQNASWMPEEVWDFLSQF